MVFAKKSCIWSDVPPGETIGSACARWLNSHSTTKVWLAVYVSSSAAEAAGASPHMNIAPQAAATPKVNMSTRRACQARWLVACISRIPFLSGAEGGSYLRSELFNMGSVCLWRKRAHPTIE